MDFKLHKDSHLLMYLLSKFYLIVKTCVFFRILASVILMAFQFEKYIFTYLIPSKTLKMYLKFCVCTSTLTPISNRYLFYS